MTVYRCSGVRLLNRAWTTPRLSSPLPRSTTHYDQPWLPLPPRLASIHARNFSTHSPLLAKKDKYAAKGKDKHAAKGKDKAKTKDSSSSATTTSDDAEGGDHPLPNPDDPTNFADVVSRWSKLEAHYRDGVKRFRSGGTAAATADTLSSLAITLPRGSSSNDSNNGGVFPLRELAEVVPRPGGRSVSLLAHDRAYIKPIMSAVQASPHFNQQPQRSTDPSANELELVLKVETEAPEETTARLRDMCHMWRERARAIKAKRDKVIQGWYKQERKISQDVMRKLQTELQKLLQKQSAAIDEVESKTLMEIQRKRQG